MILHRDFIKLSKEEKIKFNKYKDRYSIRTVNGQKMLPKPWTPNDEYPNYVYKHDSLFPNHNISSQDIEEDENWFLQRIDGFKDLIHHDSTSELDLLNYIRDNKAAFIVTSLLSYTDFGHHERFVFPEFQLSNNYKVDFLILGRSSGGYSFLFVELENPYGKITTVNGDFSTAINKGIKQVKDWKRWIPKNFSSFQQTLRKFKGPTNEDFPREFYELELDRFNFMVIAGRRDHYKPHTYQQNREILGNGERIRVLHYDNLIERTYEIIKTKHWQSSTFQIITHKTYFLNV